MAFIALRWAHLTPLDGHRAEQILPEVRRLLPTAATLEPTQDATRWEIRSEQGNYLGEALTTLPDCQNIVGYTGPSDVLIVLDPNGSIHALKLLDSEDTPNHVEAIRNDSRFLTQFLDWNPRTVLPKIEHVSGSTLTSEAVRASIEQRLSGSFKEALFSKSLSPSQVLEWFPSASESTTYRSNPKERVYRDQHGNVLGYVLRSSVTSNSTIGYQGPSDCWIVLQPDRKTIVRVGLLESFDTPDYVERIHQESAFFESYAGRNIQEIIHDPKHTIQYEGVSGATKTSWALMEGIRRRLTQEWHDQEQERTILWRWVREGLGYSVLIGAFLTMWTSLRTSKRWIFCWRLILVTVSGIYLGNLLSLSWFAGMAHGDSPSQLISSMGLIGMSALLSPITVRKNLYCQHLCPHGVVQHWLGRWMQPWNLPSWAIRYGNYVPFILLGIGFVLGILVPTWNLAFLEAFDAWTLRTVVSVSLILLIIGWVVSLRIPMAYCRFACPTGALLKMMSSGGSRDRMGLRDKWALGLVVTMLGFVFIERYSNLRNANAHSPTTHSRSNEVSSGNQLLTGQAFGTTWSIQLRHFPSYSTHLQELVQKELERIESNLSHWRPESESSLINQSNTTTAMEVSEELATLLELCLRLSRDTQGAYDITVGPLVNLWGFGPDRNVSLPPSSESIAKTLASVGWQKLHFAPETRALRKEVADLQIDLGSVLQGYAVDQVVKLLRAELGTSSEFLVEIGGEMYASGSWQIGIEDASNPHAIAQTVTLVNQALATSALSRNAREGTEAPPNHLIHPSTGHPMQTHSIGCSVVAEKCIEADALATACLLLDPDAARDLAQKWNAELKVIQLRKQP